ncbi:MAG TPA: membrane protein insertase YidC [Bryobacteraceae bacterium]|nr:membrane protein insertase YidC [Bryobacteraceae bacterium]
MEVRLLIAFVLMGLVIVWQYSMRPLPTPAAPSGPAAKTAQTAPDQAPSQAKAQAPASTPVHVAAPVEVPGQIQAGSEESFAIDTDVFRVRFSNRGGVVKSWILKTYKDHAGQPLELVNPRAIEKVAPPFAFTFKGQAPAADLNAALYKVTSSDEGRHVTFEYSDGRTAATKTFKFTPSSFLVEVTSEVVSNGIRIPHELAWRGGFGDATVANPVADQHALYYDLANSKLNQVQLKAAKDGPVTSSGQYSFAGLEDHYFAGVFLPATPKDSSKPSVDLTTFSDAVPNISGVDEQRIGAGVGGEAENQFTFFAGPKDTSLLGKVDPKLDQLIDWGTWFGFIAKPLFFWVLKPAADHITHNYGWAIVLVTVGINMVLFPLRLTSMKSSKKMQALQPQIQAINDKYKSLPLRDPKKADQQAELMELYKKNGVNPVGGCLPMVLQLPVLISFYTVLGVAIELRGASWLWVHDLSQAETLPIHILPLLVVVTQFISQKMTPSPGMDPTQAKMMLFMPLMFGYMFYFYSAGLALYWFTGGLVSIVQQLLLNQIMPTPPMAAPPKPAAKKKR